MTDNYANYPASLAEARAEKSRNAKDWTPRDALISMLRAIDSGEIAPDVLVIGYRFHAPDKPDERKIAWCISSPDSDVSLGVITRLQHDMAQE